MALEQRLNLKQTLQLRMTPQLRQAIKILQVSRAELETLVGDELCQNPTLEEAELGADTGKQESRTGDVETAESEKVEASKNEAETDSADIRECDWDSYMERSSGDFHGSTGAGSDRDDNKQAFLENNADAGDDLVTTMLDQLALIMVNEEERRVATIIIQNLDQSGYLACSVEELATLAQTSVEIVNDAREIIQEFEPPGVASLDLKDCLLVQLRLIGYEPDDFVVQIVESHLKALETRRYDRLAKTLGTSIEEVAECHRIIQSLDPKPGRNFDDGETRYIIPDVYVRRIDGEFKVLLNEEGLPRLRVSPYYEHMASKTGDSAEAQGYLQEKMRSARWIIRSIIQRQQTLQKVTESIFLRFQPGFLSHGVSHLKPMVLKDVANDIGMHESTVSRATANKYVHTPQGIFELKYFFTPGIRGMDGIDVSSESVKQKIQQIISGEDPRKPFSDQYIAESLSKQNIDIARRTVAKYREGLGILPSSKRKRYLTEI